MKKVLAILVLSSFLNGLYAQQITGAWKRNLDTAVQYLTLVDDYFSVATFDLSSKKFINTFGGTTKSDNNKLVGVIEFNTANKSDVKSSYSLSFQLSKKKLELALGGINLSWEKVDDASDALAGNWKITGREQEGKMVAMRPGARKTIKILSGTRFQWAAINSETGEFFGTGGGSYTFKDGKYTENIEFFSRDASRVGSSLSFDASLKDGKWHHSGLSSRGDKIYEIWERL
ncbi:MAG: hypothetical protein RL131_1409 [Bacteroidota bacterium]